MKIIELTQGFKTLIDDEDFKKVNQYKWRIFKSRKYLYARTSITIDKKHKDIFLHRLLLNVFDKKLFVDHINNDGLDNRKLNLRLANSITNQHNKNKSINKSSIFKGVRYNKSMKRIKRWDAQIRVNNKNIFLGCYKEEIDAAKAYNNAAKEFFGEFAKLNNLGEKHE